MNTTNTRRTGLIALQAPDRPAGKTAWVRQLLPEIEAAMTRGVSQQRIVDELARDGLQLSVDQLRVILHRIRKPKKKPPHAPSPPTPPAKPLPTPAPHGAGFDFKTHRDASEDRW